MARRRKRVWQSQRANAPSLSDDDISRLASMAAVPETKRSEFEVALQQLGTSWIELHYYEAHHPEMIEIERYIQRVRGTATKLLSLLAGHEDPANVFNKKLTVDHVPDLLRRILIAGIRSSHNLIFDSEQEKQDLQSIINHLMLLIYACDGTIKIPREQFGPLQSKRGFTVQAGLVEHTFEIYRLFGLPHVHEGKRGGCGATRFAEATLELLNRKHPTLKTLSHKRVQDLHSEWRRAEKIRLALRKASNLPDQVMLGNAMFRYILLRNGGGF